MANDFYSVVVKAGNYDPDLEAHVGALSENVEIVALDELSSRDFDDSKRPFLILHCGLTEEVCLQNARLIIKHHKLHKYPLVVLGYQVDEIVGVLESFFPVVSCAPIPYEKSDLFQCLEKVKSEYPVFEAPQELKESQPIEIEEARADLTMEIALELESLPKELFKHLSRLDMSNLSLGGREYSGKIDLNFLTMSGLLAEDKLDPEAIQGQLEPLSSWAGRHLCRDYFVCRKIADALEFDSDQRERLAQAAFYFTCSSSAQHNNILKTNYYESNLSGVRIKIADALAQSAEEVQSLVVDPRVGEVLRLLSVLVRGDEVDFKDENAILASVLMGADLIDRVCFYAGMWNPRAAYQLMRKLKSGYLKELPASVWSALVKFLSETIASRQSMFVIPKDIRLNEQLMRELKAIRNTPIRDGEERIPVAELEPGMKLSQPMFTFDGKKVLSESITLDQDIVWRLWQLSAVRPLNSPVIHSDSRPVHEPKPAKMPAAVAPPAIPEPKPISEED